MGRTASLILRALGDGVPHTSREAARLTGLGWDSVGNGLQRLWHGGLVLRSAEPLFDRRGVFRGRAGKSRNLRRAYLFLASSGSEPLTVGGVRFIPYSNKLQVDNRGHRGAESKVQIIRSFLEEHEDKAFYSKQVHEALKDRGIKKPD